MFIVIKFHRYKFFLIIFTILVSCQFQEASKTHGIVFLENRANKLIVNKSNKNDVVNIIGQPHSKSINNNDEWMYVERVLVKGEYHKLGKNILKSNNILILKFNKYGILSDKNLLGKNDIEKIAFSKKTTNNELSQRSFVEKFFSSLRSKMYKNK